MSKKAKPKYHVEKADYTVRNWQGDMTCACGSVAMCRRIARALNAMESDKKPKAKPFAFDWSGIDPKYKWAAMDKDKQWNAYDEKPECSKKHNEWLHGRIRYVIEFAEKLISHPPYPGDWRESLQQRP